MHRIPHWVIKIMLFLLWGIQTPLSHADFENAHCLHVLKELETRRNEFHPPKTSSPESFEQNDIVQIGTGTPADLQKIRPSNLSREVHLPPHPHDYLLGVYNRPIPPGFHEIALVQHSPTASLIISEITALVPHDIVFPLPTGSKHVIRKTLQKLLDLPLPIKPQDIVRFRSEEGLMLIGIVKSVSDETVLVQVLGSGKTHIPSHQVFKPLGFGNGEREFPFQPILPNSSIPITSTVVKPDFEVIRTQHPIWHPVDFFPPRGEAAEALLDGAAKFMSLNHFLKQKPETQLEWLLIYYRLFFKPHDMAQDLGLWGIHHIESFARIGVSEALQDLAFLGTMLIEAGVSVKAVFLPLPNHTLKLWFEITYPPSLLGKPQIFILDPHPSQKIALTSRYVLPYEDMKTLAQQDAHSEAAWFYLNPDRLSFSL